MPELLEALRTHHPQFPDRLVKPLLEFLLHARHGMKGDVELNIVLLVIAARTIEHPDFQKMSPDERLHRLEPFPSLGVNTRSIADSTGIPRETVRRKVAGLMRRGWLVRQGSALHYTSRAYHENSHVRGAMERLAVQYYEVIHREVAELPENGEAG